MRVVREGLVDDKTWSKVDMTKMAYLKPILFPTPSSTSNGGFFQQQQSQQGGGFGFGKLISRLPVSLSHVS